MWWPLMQSLHAHLTADTALAEAVPGLHIQYGRTQPWPEEPTLEIQRGPTQGQDLHDRERTEQELWINCLVKDKSLSPDDGTGYALLEALEEAALDSVRRWFERDDAPHLDNIAQKVSLARIEPDGDLFRPHVGSHIVLLIDSRKTD